MNEKKIKNKIIKKKFSFCLTVKTNKQRYSVIIIIYK